MSTCCVSGTLREDNACPSGYTFELRCTQSEREACIGSTTEVLCPIFVWTKHRLSSTKRKSFFPPASPATIWTEQCVCLPVTASERTGCFGVLLQSSNRLTPLLPFHIAGPSPHLSVARAFSCLLRQKGAFVGMGSAGRETVHPSLGTETKRSQFPSVPAQAGHPG